MGVDLYGESGNVATRTGASKKKLVIPKSFINVEGVDEDF